MPKRNKPKTPPLPLWRFYRYIVDPNCCRNWKFSDNDNDRDNNGKDNDNDNSDDGRDNTNDGNMPTVSNNTTWTTTRMASTTATTTVKKLNFPLNLSHVFTLKPWGPASYGGRRREQCDQMAKLVLQYLAIYNIEILPKIIQIVQSRFTTLPNTKWTLKIWPKISQFVANAVKFRQIWSHWSWEKIRPLLLVQGSFSTWNFLKLNSRFPKTSATKVCVKVCEASKR